jgi:hypothetical protein
LTAILLEGQRQFAEIVDSAEFGSGAGSKQPS